MKWGLLFIIATVLWFIGVIVLFIHYRKKKEIKKLFSGQISEIFASLFFLAAGVGLNKVILYVIFRESQSPFLTNGFVQFSIQLFIFAILIFSGFGLALSVYLNNYRTHSNE